MVVVRFEHSRSESQKKEMSCVKIRYVTRMELKNIPRVVVNGNVVSFLTAEKVVSVDIENMLTVRFQDLTVEKVSKE